MALNPMARVVGRLLLVQGSWTYERMQGVGIGYASLPLLEPLAKDPARHREAVARAGEYFNAHPYLAGIAIGAAARAELDGVPGPTVQRLKTALAGPLGALGDQLFWIGVVPAVMAAMVAAVTEGAGLVAVGVGVGLYLGVRLAVTWWGTWLGFRSGLGVSAALRRSGIAEAVDRVGLGAGLLIGVAVPLAAHWLAIPGLGWSLPVAVAGGVGGLVAGLVRTRLPSARVVALSAMAAVLIWHWSH